MHSIQPKAYLTGVVPEDGTGVGSENRTGAIKKYGKRSQVILKNERRTSNVE